MNFSISNKSIILIVMNIFLLSILLWQFYPAPNDRTQSHYVNSQAISIAISKIQYGLDKGYAGYNIVYLPFLKIEGDNDRGILISRLNGVIDKVLNLSDVASGGVHYMPCLPTWSDFVTVAFFIFGPNAKSMFYLYMLLLTVSILIFIMTFRHNPKYLYLSLVTIATFIVIINAPAVVQMTRAGHRFWSYLAIVPAFYIAILFIEKHDFYRWRLIGGLIQASILVFIIHVRNVAMYEFIFIFIAVPLYIIVGYIIRSRFIFIAEPFFRIYIISRHIIKSREINAIISFIKGIRIWPLVLLLICFGVMTAYAKVKLHDDYSKIKTGYPFWHMIYISLSAHPDACAKYNICEYDDKIAYKFVEKKMGITFDDKIWADFAMGANPNKAKFIVFFSPIYGDILKKEVVRIIKDNPWFFISSFYYKIIPFPVNYKSGYTGTVHPLSGDFIPQWNMRWFLISMTIIGFFLAKKSINDCRWHGNFSIVLLMFLSAFMMLLLAYPVWANIMDPAFTLTAMIFIIIAILSYYLWHFIMMMQKRIRNKMIA